jgi:ketosteroid isomerase-like protein
MAQEHLELARRYLEAFNESGLDGTAHMRHPEIEVYDPPAMPDAGRHTGEAQVRARVESYMDAGWDGQFRDPELIESGDEVLVLWRAELSSQVGIELQSEVAHILLFEDGKIRRIRQFFSRQEGLEAAGLSD